MATIALALFLFSAIFAPEAVRVMVQVLGGYLVIRFLSVVAAYPFGLWRIRHKEREARSLTGLGAPVVPHLGVPVHHIVILPNYREPISVLERTLTRLQQQEGAAQNLTVVLAMEAAEAGSEAKAWQLASKYSGSFARILISIHPPGLPGEVTGKGSNEAWAARVAKEELVDRLGLPIGSLTISSCDADSLFHPHYFVELGRQFAADNNRYRRFWQAAFRYQNNLWDVPAPVRALAFLNNMVQVADLANPLAVNLPLSTYSLSLQLAHEVDYWDEMVIAEDWHMFLRCFFGGQGLARVRAIYLPTTADAVSGPNFGRAIANSYRQRVRHAWGAADIGYILQQWNRQADVALPGKVMFLAKVVHDHLLFTHGGLLLALGSVFLVAQGGPAGITRPGAGAYNVFFQAGNILTGAATWGVWAYEHMQARKRSPGWKPKHVVADLLTWPMLVVVTLILVMAPTLEAQWRQMAGDNLIYTATPKQLPAARNTPPPST